MLHPHEILNELRRLKVLLELAHQSAVGLQQDHILSGAGDGIMEDLTAALDAVRELIAELELGPDADELDELEGDELDDALGRNGRGRLEEED